MRYFFGFLLFFSGQLSFAQRVTQALFNENEFAICGHRGGFYSEFPENSLAVLNYVTSQARHRPLFLEIDVRQSINGTLYILHDESVDRTTNGVGNIKELSDEYIHQLFLKSKAGGLSGERVIELSYLLDRLRDRSVFLMLDIKSNAWKETAELILKNGWASRCLFLTFKPEDTERVMRVSDQLYVSALIRSEVDWLKIRSYSIPMQHVIAYVERTVTTELIHFLKQQGSKIMADVSEHTTNDGKLYTKAYYQHRLKDQKLDILITDFPIEVAAMIK